MLSIAICDDELRQAEELRELIEEYAQKRKDFTAEVMCFDRGDGLLSAAEKQGGFDICIIDIIMPEKNGIQTAAELRARSWAGEIIYLTVSNEFAAESYETGAMYYLLKPTEKEKLFAALDMAADRGRHQRGEGVMAQTRSGARRLIFDNIIYAERAGRIMRYICSDEVVETVTLRTSFKEMAAPLLADKRFCMCGASYVLNMQHVTGVDGQRAYLDNGGVLTLPRSSAVSFKSVWGEYWLGGWHA